MAMRRLPVIQEPAGEDAEAAARPAWQWVLIGSGLLVTIWTPTVAISLSLARRLASSAEGAVGAGPAASLVAVTFALSSMAAGYLVARFGPRAQLRHTAWSGVLAGAEIWALALLGGAFTSALVAASAFVSLAALASAFCALGGWLRRRKK
jgi:hypothetical protein